MDTADTTAPGLPLRQLLRVRAGQSQMLHWTAGTVVRPLRGGVWLSQTPHWLGEELMRSRWRVEAHATHVMAADGWVVLWAERDAVLQVLHWPPVSGPLGAGRAGVVQPVRAFMAAVRRRLGPRGPAHPA